MAREALACARRYYERTESDATFTQPSKFAMVLTYATDLAVFVEDRGAAMWAGARAHVLLGDDEQFARYAGILNKCRRKLDLDSWPGPAR